MNLIFLIVSSAAEHLVFANFLPAFLEVQTKYPRLRKLKAMRVPGGAMERTALRDLSEVPQATDFSESICPVRLSKVLLTVMAFLSCSRLEISVRILLSST